MPAISLKDRITRYLKNTQGWVAGGTCEKLGESVGYKASNVSRRLRELENEGILERKIERGFVWYRYRAMETQARILVPEQREMFQKDYSYLR